MMEVSSLPAKISKFKKKVVKLTGHTPSEVYISFDDFKELELLLGVKIRTIAEMIVVPDETVPPGGCRVEINGTSYQ